MIPYINIIIYLIYIELLFNRPKQNNLNCFEFKPENQLKLQELTNDLKEQVKIEHFKSNKNEVIDTLTRTKFVTSGPVSSVYRDKRNAIYIYIYTQRERERMIGRL